MSGLATLTDAQIEPESTVEKCMRRAAPAYAHITGIPVVSSTVGPAQSVLGPRLTIMNVV